MIAGVGPAKGQRTVLPPPPTHPTTSGGVAATQAGYGSLPAQKSPPASVGAPTSNNSAARAIALTVDAAKTIRIVDERVFALNTAVWDGVFKAPSTLSALTAMKTRALRFPGGSTSDTYDWKTNRSYAAGTRTLNNWTWTNSFDDFAQVALKLKAQVFVTANYGSGTAQQAADWVKYSNVTKKYGFKYWELGNECYGTWEEDIHAKKWDAVTYATQAKDYFARMRKVDKTIKVGVVVTPGEDSFPDAGRTAVKNPRTKATHKGWTPVMLAKLKALGVTPDFAIYHRYEQNPKDQWNPGENDAALLQSAKTWAKDEADLRQQLVDYLGSTAAAKIELVVTENNSVSFNPGKQTTSLVNALFLADSTGQILQTKFNALVWWDLHNSQEKGNNNSSALYGWRAYGDYGVLGPKNGGYPTYYVTKLLASFARGGDKVVQATSGSTLLSIYAVKRASGALTLLLINKHPTSTLAGTVNLKNYAPKSSASVLFYGKTQDTAAKTGKGSRDLAASTKTGVKSMFSVSCAPYSVTLLTLSPAK